tara:strand:- start:260 stop:520 length:261 start_codon:yes stop_codon:yes gene_type:complete
MKKLSSLKDLKQAKNQNDLNLPEFSNHLDSLMRTGELFKVEGTNVVRVPFGVRKPIKQRPEKSDHWATLILPFQPLGSPTPPPQAA